MMRVALETQTPNQLLTDSGYSVLPEKSCGMTWSMVSSYHMNGSKTLGGNKIRRAIARIAKYAAITIGLLIVTLAILVAAFLWQVHVAVFSTSDFDAKVWFAPQTNETDMTCYRGGMARDIKNRLFKPGMSREEVEILLGQPDGVSTPSEYQYILGMCSGMRMDYDNLHVYFDPKGKFTRAAIIQH